MCRRPPSARRAYLLDAFLPPDALEQEVQHKLERLGVGLPEHRWAQDGADLLLRAGGRQTEHMQAAEEQELRLLRRLGIDARSAQHRFSEFAGSLQLARAP